MENFVFKSLTDSIRKLVNDGLEIFSKELTLFFDAIQDDSDESSKMVYK
jgi:hypothetical protein